MRVSFTGNQPSFLQNIKKNGVHQKNSGSHAIRNLLRNAVAEKAENDAKTNTASAQNAAPKPAARKENPAFINIMNMEDLRPNAFHERKDVTHAGQLSGHYEYSKEDVLEKMNRKTLLLDGVTSTVDITAQAKANGISNNTDFTWANADLSYASSNIDEFVQSLDYISSRYVAMKDRITAEFSGEEQAANLTRLDEMMNTFKDTFAKNFADKVGGVFEDLGVTGEKEQIYQSVLSEIDKKTQQYSDFTKANKNYANINSADEPWLAKDTAYMASELRKAMAANSDAPQTATATETSGTYTADELVKMQSIANEIVSYTKHVSGSTNEIYAGSDSEESLGVKLAELNLKGIVFNEHSGISDRIKNAVTKSIDRVISDTVNKQQEYMDLWTQRQLDSLPGMVKDGYYSQAEANKRVDEIKQNFMAIDTNAVYSIISKVEDTYAKTGDASKSLMDGVVFAKDAYDKKADDSKYDGVERYDSRHTYFDDFFENTRNSQGTNAYEQKESEQDAIINSWNSLMESVTSNSDALLKKQTLSMLV